MANIDSNNSRISYGLGKGIPIEEFDHRIASNIYNLSTVNKEDIPDFKDPVGKSAFNSKNCCYKFLCTLGLVPCAYIGSMSENAVATITEVIGSDLKTFRSITSIARGYLLTTVAFAPLFGKLSDIFGRKPVELASIALFAIGSLGCALVNSMTLFVVFRCIAGIGDGGITSMAFIMVTDIIPLEDRSTYLSIISITFAIAQISGPIIGGAISEVSWRITFYIQLPLCAILAALVIFVMDLPNSEEYAWNSAPIITLFVLMIAFFVAFVIIELKVSFEPVLPSRVFVHNVIISLIASFMVGAVKFVAVYYLPVYYQFVHGATPSESGYRLIPFLAVISICCFISGYLIKIFNTIRGIKWIGGVTTIVGVCLVALMRQNYTLVEQIFFILINGIGLGLIFQLTIFMLTLSVPSEDVAIASGLFTFAMNIGGVVSLSIAGTAYNSVLNSQLTQKLPLLNPADLLDLQIVKQLSWENKEIFQTCYYLAFKYAYICMLPFAILLLLSVLGLKKVQIPRKSSQQSYYQ
ncbi:MFS general substrate transporter [Conidiobolus coronatus NRRL 28638]|uniref:MFS general substrate transporter n=1 Tax=Conidiobolus coronatus (strain ATCC 28846 / CBS 209.66 / NRRL 28638) TaxID=796925 RepID=A0A137NZ05_CONC2|nr:MFS general substrate transporter [Conidiobolus coronatus NRRL 28638]|eukprot:KXN68073.1 MFS general substrate transporter [Conidiobolus coronatus NRRL 28638]